MSGARTSIWGLAVLGFWVMLLANVVLVVYAGLLSKQGRLDLGRVEISQVIAEAVTTLTPMARRRDLELEADIHVCLKPVFLNLLI